MRAVLSWLRDYAAFDEPVEVLADALSNLGLVVDGVQRVGSELPGVIVARVLATRPHPDADRVHLVDVDTGDGQATQIVCGAFNMRAGDLVPLATLGTVMPGGMEIARRKMRGQWSNGMLCSAAELELPEPTGADDPGILILPPEVAEPGTPLADALELRPDVVFDLDVSPNRPDALCMAGVARDLAAALHLPFSLDRAGSVGAGAGSSRGLAESVGGLAEAAGSPVEAAAVEVLAPEACPRFTATVLSGVSVGSSPTWLARRLLLAGMRPINSVVDASNYVMLDLGHPNHPYDLDRLAGRGLQVRWAAEGEELVTLDGVARKLQPGDCVIADGEGNGVGIGGIMGGASAEITAGTTMVLLEVAWFSPERIARTGSRLGLHTEARVRFERGCDTGGFHGSVDRFVELLGGVRRGPTTDRLAAAYLPVRSPIQVRTSRIEALLGVTVDGDRLGQLLEPIGLYTAAGSSPDQQVVSVPSWRPDVEREIDVVEEVARLYGYGRLPRTLPPGTRQAARLTPYQRQRRQVADILAGAGLSEAWTTTFLPPDEQRLVAPGRRPVTVANPLDRSESTLRPSLLPGLLRAVRFNQDRQSPEVALFEIGKVFEVAGDGSSLPVEREVLGAVLAGAGRDARAAAATWTVVEEALRLEGLRLRNVESVTPGFHPTRQALVEAGACDGGAGGSGPGRAVGSALGTVGEVDPEVVSAFGVDGRVGYLEVDLERLVAQPRRCASAAAVSRFPASDVDLAFLVDEAVAASDVRRSLAESVGELGESVGLFDVYRDERLPAGQRSLAFRVRLRALDRTLTDEEVTVARQKAIDAVAAAHGAQLRV